LIKVDSKAISMHIIIPEVNVKKYFYVFYLL
jgi:hypothetical protein